MLRIVLGSCLLGIAALVFADSPQKPIQPIPADKTERLAGGCCPLLADVCVCASYPIFQEGTNILYYAEVCEPANACGINDIGYYWASELDWPVPCIPRPTGCQPCDPFTDPDDLRARKDIGTPFAGMTSKRNKADTAAGQLFPIDVRWKDNGGIDQDAHPRLGVKSESGNGLIVSFKISFQPAGDPLPPVEERTVYAKLLVVRVKADKTVVNAPIQGPDRLLFVGYEVGDLLKEEKDEAIFVANTKPAYRKTESGGCSEFVRSVTVGGNRFLVLVAQ